MVTLCVRCARSQPTGNAAPSLEPAASRQPGGVWACPNWLAAS